jgi:glycosyltransferase involved in cell wall biosynthesis
MKILFVLGSLSFGGAERHTVDLFQRLPQHGIHTKLVYLKRREALLPALGENRESDAWCADLKSGIDFKGLWRLAEHLETESPDILVCVNCFPLFYGFIAKFIGRLSMPVIEIYHSTELPLLEALKHRLIYRRLFNACLSIIYVSHTQRIYWEARGLMVSKGSTIQNGVNPEHFVDRFSSSAKNALRASLGFAADDYLIGICAALRPEKYHGDLLAAISILRQRGLKATGLIIGDGIERATIEAQIAKLGLGAFVKITGFQADVRPFIAACDAMTIVSHQVETFSIAALEAMALGKAMVMSEVGGAAEQVIPGVTGYLFPRGDIPALADALEAIADDDLRMRMSAAARTHVVENFSLECMISRYVDAFKNAVKRVR